MGDVRLVDASPAHVGTISNRIRLVDAEECEGMGQSAKQALRRGLVLSDKCWTVTIDGRPEAMFGRIIDSELTGDATVWFLGTDAVLNEARTFMLWGGPILKGLGDSRYTLRNLVSLHNDKAIRLLRRWGFDISDEVIEVRGVPFVRFERAYA